MLDGVGGYWSFHCASTSEGIISSLLKWVEDKKVIKELDGIYQLQQYCFKIHSFFTECHVSKLRFYIDKLKESHLSFQLNS
jgi:hypothetical protein